MGSVEVSSGGVSIHCCISLAWRLGGDVVILFHTTNQTKGEAYSVDGSALCWLQMWRQKGKLAQIVRNWDAERITDIRQS